MGYFDKIYIKEKKTGNLVDITDLDREHYESFLNAMNQLRAAYNVAIERKKKEDTSEQLEHDALLLGVKIMAGIDKMSWTREQKYQFFEWYFKHYNINKQGMDMLENMTEYDETTTVNNVHVVTNFSRRTDDYLRKHCKLKFIQKRLDEQYG